MLSDTIKQVQDAEQKAADIIRDAEAQAAAIEDEAREAAKKRRKAAEHKAEAAAKTAVADATKSGEEEKANYASSVDAQLEAERQQALSRTDEAVDAIIAGLV